MAGSEAEQILNDMLDGWGRYQSRLVAQAVRDRKTFGVLAIEALAAAGLVVVPREPTEVMLDKGEYVNSEWLNDLAPIGQAMYRLPAKAVYESMISAAHPAPEGGVT